MTQLSLTSPELGALFDEVDLRPMPQSDAVRRVLEYWHTKRGAREMPLVDDVDPNDIPRFASYVFVYDQIADGVRKSLRLVSMGENVRELAGEQEPGEWLMDGVEPVFADRVYELARLALERGEPVGGMFHDLFPGAGELSVELMVAPLADAHGRHMRVFGALAFRHPEHGWEDEPDSSG